MRRKQLNKLKGRLITRWLYAAAALLSLSICYYAITHLIVIRGSILFIDPQHEYELWLDGNPVSLNKVDDGWIIKTTPGRHTLTIQNPARTETKKLVTVRSGRTVTVQVGQPNGNQSDVASIGAATYWRRSKDGKYLFILSDNGRVMRRYNTESNISVALTDPVFDSPLSISFSPDDNQLVAQARSGNWYSFDFRKTDFLQSRFSFIAGKDVVDLAYDPSRFRFGFVAAESPGGPLALYTAEADMSNRHLEIQIADIHSPEITWAPHGRSIVIRSDPSYNKHNLQIFDLAKNELRPINASDVARVEYSPRGDHLMVEERRENATSQLAIIQVDTDERKEIGQLRQTGLSSWHPTDEVVWAVFDDDQPQLTAVNLNGERQMVRLLPALPGVWQSVIPLIDNQTVYIQSSLEIWRVPLNEDHG